MSVLRIAPLLQANLDECSTKKKPSPYVHIYIYIYVYIYISLLHRWLLFKQAPKTERGCQVGPPSSALVHCRSPPSSDASRSRSRNWSCCTTEDLRRPRWKPNKCPQNRPNNTQQNHLIFFGWTWCVHRTLRNCTCRERVNRFEDLPPTWSSLGRNEGRNSLAPVDWLLGKGDRTQNAGNSVKIDLNTSKPKAISLWCCAESWLVEPGIHRLAAAWCMESDAGFVSSSGTLYGRPK